MKLTVFQSDKGDALLLESGNKRALIDGGMRRTYSKHVAPALGRIRESGKHLDWVCVTHTDQDHISGVLQLLDDLVEWRVYDYQRSVGNKKAKRPKAPRPPEIKKIWHNAFHEQIGKNAGAIADMLAATAAVFGTSSNPRLLEYAQTHQELGLSISEAIQLSRRISADQLRIPLNPEAAGKLIMVRTAQPTLVLGPLKFSVIGPFEEDLRRYRTEWNQWLDKSEATLRRLAERAERDKERLGLDDHAALTHPLEDAARGLAQSLVARSTELGNREKVTKPNLASIMTLVEEGSKKLLLTGDGHWQDILKGLKHHRKFDSKGRIHLNALKVQHHGSEHNIRKDFTNVVTADHYIFCGNGKHENPDLRVVELIINSRTRPRDSRSFKLWFNCRDSQAPDKSTKAHMREVEALVSKAKKKLGTRLDAAFLERGSFEIAI
jgi:beta-lactamase superfamily II metal-dependent hydrolase